MKTANQALSLISTIISQTDIEVIALRRTREAEVFTFQILVSDTIEYRDMKTLAKLVLDNGYAMAVYSDGLTIV
jgi:predicted amino acid-binding ACT domain protein